MVAHEVPASSTLAVPHGPASVGVARRRLRRDLGDREIPDTVIDDAVLILSELLSNSCRYARPLGRLSDLDLSTPDALLVGAHSPTRRAAPCADGEWDSGGVLVSWQMHRDGSLTLEVTDGGSATRPMPARPSLTSRGGRGLSIVGRLASEWGVRDEPGQVTVWAAIPTAGHHGDAPEARAS
jgi:two-component sensor histidine kinase